MRREAIDSGAVDWVFSGALADQGYTDTELSTLARILSRVCPSCDAAVGRWCRTAGGAALERLDDQHASRRRAGWR